MLAVGGQPPGLPATTPRSISICFAARGAARKRLRSSSSRRRACCGSRRSFSPLEALTAGKFAPVLPEEGPAAANRLVLCSGKLYYDLAAARDKAGLSTAIARLEQLAPLPEAEIANLASAGSRSIIWAQEEPENMGAWNFLRPRLAKIFPEVEIGVAARPASSSPATGTFSVFQREQEEIVTKALG